MTVLLDTHAFLWFVADDPKLSAQANAMISNRSSTVLLSAASYWEIAIKVGSGKLEIGKPLRPFVEGEVRKNQFLIIPITIQHAARLIEMPLHHRDPFDRMLVAQALVEDIPLISSDDVLDQYGVARVW